MGFFFDHLPKLNTELEKLTHPHVDYLSVNTLTNTWPIKADGQIDQ